MTPADLISAIVTEEGALVAPFGPALAAAVAARAGPRVGLDAGAGDAGGGGRLMATVAIEGQRGSVVARTTTDRPLLRAFLERDRRFAAYAICDLDDREFGRTRWGVAFDGDELVAVALEYAGLSPSRCSSWAPTGASRRSCAT